LAFWWFICEAEARIMANITKIILGLNILAGGAGIFFGITKSGQASELVEKAKTAETKAKAAQGKVTGLEKDKKDLKTSLSTKNQEAITLQESLIMAKENVTASGGQLSTLQTENSNLMTANQVLTTERANLQSKADEATLAQAALSTAKSQIQTLQTELQKLKAPKKPKGPKKPTGGTGGMVGKIANVDPRTGSLILNRGSAHGFKVGDQYNVFRNNTLIGRIEVTRLSSTNTGLSIAQRSEGLGVPTGAQFQVNDDLIKIP
jgi:myosin heavy subunit